MFYFQDVKADKRVNVNFIGSDTGTLNVVSNGGVRINGEIGSANSSVTLDARGGNIIMENANATLNAGDLTLAASGSVGTSTPSALLSLSAYWVWDHCPYKCTDALMVHSPLRASSLQE